MAAMLVFQTKETKGALIIYGRGMAPKRKGLGEQNFE
jgi:hypothetical protein